MIRRQQGSILFSVIVLLMLVGALLVTGGSFFLGFAGEARSLESRLGARHLARSGLAYAEATGREQGQHRLSADGRFRLRRVGSREGLLVLESRGESLQGDRVVARFELKGEFRRIGTGLKLVRVLPTRREGGP